MSSSTARTLPADGQPLAANAKPAKDLASADHAEHLSPGVLDFLRSESIDLESLRANSVLSPTPEMLDESGILSNYFISSSHNSYLAANQLTGESSLQSYMTVLKGGGRCVEIDAWDGKEGEPTVKVTHGYTFTSHLDFREVCQTIVRADDEDDSAYPIVISLECHCSPERQKHMVSVFEEVFGDRLLREKVGERDHITLAQAKDKILIKVEYHGSIAQHLLGTDSTAYRDQEVPGHEEESDSSGDSSDDEETKEIRAQRKQKATIIPSLHNLGVYTLSVKPKGTDFLEKEPERPPNFVLNISESGLSKLLSTRLEDISEHTTRWLARVYPKGLRVTSRNLNPLPFWRAGAQIAALNWQTFDLAVQLNTALFAGSGGWIRKPTRVPEQKKIKLHLHIKAASSLHPPKDAQKKGLQPYVKVYLYHSKGDQRHTTAHIKPSDGNNRGCDPFFDEECSFEYQDENLVFLRFKLTHKDSMFSRDDDFAVSALLLDSVKDGWRLIKLFDLDGQATGSSLLVKVDRS